MVLEGDDVAEALVQYAAESGVRCLVLGSASFRWFQRYPVSPPLILCPFFVFFPVTDRPLQVSSVLMELN